MTLRDGKICRSNYLSMRRFSARVGREIPLAHCLQLQLSELLVSPRTTSNCVESFQLTLDGANASFEAGVSKLLLQLRGCDGAAVANSMKQLQRELQGLQRATGVGQMSLPLPGSMEQQTAASSSGIFE